MGSLGGDFLSKLCSADQLELLNAIDRLRLQGMYNYVSLPQIIVCGDQSSGKSSVLEAISGVSFPVNANLCTRFPTELILRRSSQRTAKVSIVPDGSRRESERQALRGFRETLSGFDRLPDVIELAKSAMGLSAHGRAFSKDILRVEVSGPDRIPLTIVDLPGLIHSQTKQQSTSDVQLIQEVVEGYMKQSRCIILAVVSAKNDYANQIVLRMSQQCDPTGYRTLGVITKPDTLVPGSGSEGAYIALAANQDVEFRLGWHVVKNMDSDKGASTLAERDARETEFFAAGSWTGLPPASLGIQKLRVRLSRVLLRHIASELPSLMEEIENRHDACQAQLEALGKPRATLDEQRLYLFEVCEAFQKLVKSSVDGTYNHAFFEDAKTSKGYQQRIRAVVQNLNQNFSGELELRGHYRQFSSDPAKKGDETVIKITRDAFLDHIQHLMQRTRGRELPGTFNPMIVADLFLEQARPWEKIVQKHIQKIWEATSAFLDLIVRYIADDSAYRALQSEIFIPEMKRILKELNEKTAELLVPHQSGHPITYNSSFSADLAAVRRERMKESAEKAVKEFFGVEELRKATKIEVKTPLSELVAKLTYYNEPDMDRFAAQEALDCLNAYYRVAMKRFTDDVAVEAIEAKLVSTLCDILSPVKIFKMSNELVTRVAGEPEESRAEREQLARQLEVLQQGLEICKRFVGMRVGGKKSIMSRLHRRKIPVDFSEREDDEEDEEVEEESFHETGEDTGEDEIPDKGDDEEES